MRTIWAILIKHRLSISVLAIAALLAATACATSNDTTQPTAPPDTTIWATASPSTTAPPETPPPDVSTTQLPIPTTAPTAITIPPPLLGNIAVETSTRRSCSLREDGSVYCWGANPFDKDGNRIRFDTDIPIIKTGISNAIAFVSVPSHRCVVHADGTVSCWGGNRNGRLGDGTDTGSATPVKVINITDATDVSVGSDHSCVLHAGGAVSCWGSNEFGQLGNGETADLYVPAQIGGIVDAVAVSAGEDHTCALHAGGAVSCWGSNEFGQLGNGTTDNSAAPARVSGITDAVAVVADYRYSCVIHAVGEVSCWGSNRFGTLGQGNSIDPYDFSENPTRVPEVSQAASLHTDEQYLCALRSDNTAICWGYDKYGIFSGTNGSAADITAPTELSYSRYIISMSAGGGYICVIHTDTTVYCWGYDPIYSVGKSSEQANSGKLGRAYIDPNRNLAYIIAPSA